MTFLNSYKETAFTELIQSKLLNWLSSWWNEKRESTVSEL